MDHRKVKRTRELIDGGFYDDLEVFDVLFERCVGAILSDISRSRTKEIRAHVTAELVRGRANRAGIGRMRRKKCAVAMDR